MTLAPLIAKGKIMVGVSGGELGIRGFIQALDAATGKPRGRRSRSRSGQRGRRPGRRHVKTGGVSVWIPHLRSAARPRLLGTGNAAQWIGDQRPGDNLYSASVLALEWTPARSAAITSTTGNDSWDWDEVSAPS